MIMDGTNPYEEFNWFQNFNPLNLPQEVDELKNYDAALALAAAGRMNEAYIVILEVNIHNKLDPVEFQNLDLSMGKSTKLNSIGMVDQDRGKLEEALEYFQKALRILEDLKDERNQQL